MVAIVRSIGQKPMHEMKTVLDFRFVSKPFGCYHKGLLHFKPVEFDPFKITFANRFKIIVKIKRSTKGIHTMKKILLIALLMVASGCSVGNEDKNAINTVPKKTETSQDEFKTLSQIYGSKEKWSESDFRHIFLRCTSLYTAEIALFNTKNEQHKKLSETLTKHGAYFFNKYVTLLKYHTKLNHKEVSENAGINMRNLSIKYANIMRESYYNQGFNFNETIKSDIVFCTNLKNVFDKK